MEVLRVPPYPLITTWSLPIPNYEYVVYVEDLVDHSYEEFNLSSDANGKVIYQIPLSKVQFDRNFLIRFYDEEHEHILLEDNLNIIRPYVNPSEYGTTASEIEEYKMQEIIARAMIDTVVGDGFYNHKLVINGQGQGLDYFSLWHASNRVLKVYENNVLVYDADDPSAYAYSYDILLDNSAIYRTENATASDERNRMDYNPTKIVGGSGDLGFVGYRVGDFPKGYDFTIVLDVGYKVVPTDVVVATKMLIEDIKCGKLDYYKRYITSYNTDQFKIQFDKSVLSGTGNAIVDKILERYVNTITRPGVL
jgi:hypothetical protein